MDLDDPGFHPSVLADFRQRDRLALRHPGPLRAQTTRWKGFLAHVTETCALGGVNVITDVATAPDSRALPEIHNRLHRRSCYPAGTWSTAATPPWSTWSGPHASTASR